MTNKTQLVTLEDITKMSAATAVDALRSKESVQPIIDRVRREATSEVLDVNQKKDRERMGSLGRSVSTSKTTLIKAIKAAISDMEAKVKDVKATCKYAEEELNQIRDEVLAPRKAWEEEQERIKKAREEEMLGRIDNIREMGNPNNAGDLSALKETANALEAMPITKDHFEEFLGDALAARDDALKSINNAIIAQVEEEARNKALKEQELTIAINNIKLKPTEAFSKSANEIRAMMNELDTVLTSISEDKFGERTQEAESAVAQAKQQLQMLFNSKRQQEAEGAEKAEQGEQHQATVNQEAQAATQTVAKPQNTAPAMHKAADLVPSTKQQIDSGMVSISMREYRHLQQCEAELDALKAHGVDNWSGYDDAMASLNDRAA
jgi:hypothetical protein